MGQDCSSNLEIWIQISRGRVVRELNKATVELGQPFDLRFRSYHNSEISIFICVDGKRTEKPYKIGTSGNRSLLLTVKPEKHFEAVLMRPGQHYIRVTHVYDGRVLVVEPAS